MRTPLPLVFALTIAATEAHPRLCGRWTATLVSDAGPVATIQMRVRSCGALPAHVPGACEGRYRCHGHGCLARRGTFVAYGEGALAEFHPRRRRKPSCFSRPPLPSESSRRYACYATDGTVVDQGTFSCETRVTCKGFAC
jgi:hypothetical protein